MRHFPSILDRSASDALMDRFDRGFEADGFGVWAVEAPGVAPFIGFVGLEHPTFDAYFTPAVEVGWRLAAAWWGNGYATEGARAAVRYGFDEVGLDEIVSFCIPANERSWRVMERIGMSHHPQDDFDHPRFPEHHRLRRHLLYRIGPEAD
jgi:RimJ/RimL family protein N-acetyltransferase